MSLDHLTLDIKYNVKNNEYEMTGKFNQFEKYDIIEYFLIDRLINAKKDDNKPVIKDNYFIRIKWYPKENGNDKIIVSSDTGNNQLRDGILMTILGQLN